MEITKTMARLVSETCLENLPQDVVAYSKSLGLSAFGAMVAGLHCPAGEITRRYVQRAGGNPEASVLGAEFRTSVEMAALANGTFAHATEYEDDSFPEAVSSYTIFPAVFALAEKLGSSGADAIAAFVAGYEVQARIGLACLEARRMGYMVLSLAGTLGCAASGARLLGLDKERTAMALSIAASQGSGIGYQTGTMAHILEMGIAARNGLTAALLAADGFTGKPDVLEAPRGLFNLITAGNVEDPERIVAEWGQPYRVMEVGIKQYPCCYHLQRIIEATLELREEAGLRAGDIERIEVEVNRFFPTVVQHPEPRNEVEAQFSLPHVIAAAIVEGDVLPDSLSLEKIQGQCYRDLRAKVKTIIRSDWNEGTNGWTPNVHVRLRNGKLITRSPQHARGQPPAFLSFEEVTNKYRRCLAGWMDSGRIDRSIALFARMETLEDVSHIIDAVES